MYYIESVLESCNNYYISQTYHKFALVHTWMCHQIKSNPLPSQQNLIVDKKSIILLVS